MSEFFSLKKLPECHLRILQILQFIVDVYIQYCTKCIINTIFFYFFSKNFTSSSTNWPVSIQYIKVSNARLLRRNLPKLWDIYALNFLKLLCQCHYYFSFFVNGHRMYEFIHVYDLYEALFSSNFYLMCSMKTLVYMYSKNVQVVGVEVEGSESQRLGRYVIKI